MASPDPVPPARSVGRRSSVLDSAMGTWVVYRDAGGGLSVGGLAFAALFALIPALVLAIAVLYAVLDDPQDRSNAVELLFDTFPALRDVTQPLVDQASTLLTAGSIVAVIALAWAASGLYVSLTNAIERVFPGDRPRTWFDRVAGLLLVVLLIAGTLAAVGVAGIVTVVLQALNVDPGPALAILGEILVLAGATALAYGIYRAVPTAPPSSRASRLPALLVGLVVGLLTLLYGLISPWLVSSFQALGAMASVFVALLWLRLVFMAILLGAAMARYRDLMGGSRPSVGGYDPPRQPA